MSLSSEFYKRAHAVGNIAGSILKATGRGLNKAFLKPYVAVGGFNALAERDLERGYAGTLIPNLLAASGQQAVFGFGLSHATTATSIIAFTAASLAVGLTTSAAAFRVNATYIIGRDETEQKLAQKKDAQREQAMTSVRRALGQARRLSA